MASSRNRVRPSCYVMFSYVMSLVHVTASRILQTLGSESVLRMQSSTKKSGLQEKVRAKCSKNHSTSYETNSYEQRHRNIDKHARTGWKMGIMFGNTHNYNETNYNETNRFSLC